MKIVVCMTAMILLCALLVGCTGKSGEGAATSAKTTASTTSTTDRIVLPDDTWD